MTTIKNLAFKGGGVLGIAYSGAITLLEQKNILSSIEKVAGTSAGAITAMLVALNCSAAEIKNIVSATNFKSFEDSEDILRIPFKYGLYKGEAPLKWIQGIVASKGLAETATFEDLKNKGFKDLHVFATDLNTQDVKEFSFATTPTTIVAEAVRASMSIPLFFDAWQFSNSVPDNHIYIDGGMVYNFPITTFDVNGIANPETLGFYLLDISNKQPDNNLGYDSLLEYTKILFTTMLDAQNIDFKENSTLEKRTVIIDNLGISATNFDLTTEQEQQLYQSGLNCPTIFCKNGKCK